MEGTIRRKDIITDEALNWGEDYKKTLELAIGKNKEFVGSIIEMHEANKLLRGSIDQKQFAENQKKVNEAAQKNIAIWKEQIQIENALIATKKKNELATESTNRELTKQRILLSEQNKAVKQEVQNQLGLVTVYQKVQNKLNSLGKEYSDLSIRKNLGAKLTDQEIKRYEFLERKITTYDQALKLTDATQGKHQRNVGNYTGSFNALNNSVNQISREMPAFANSMNTGFMAISNNIPAFFDALQGIKAKNIELAKSGQPTKSMLTELGGALFSVQSLMSVGVTLLTVYGAKLVEWAANSLKSSKAIDEMAKSTETLNKAFEDTNVSKAMEEVNQLGINIQLAKDGFLDKNKVVDQYNETIGKTTGLVSNLNEAEKELTENGDAYIKMTLYKAAANLALEEAAKQSLEAEKTSLKSLKEFKSSFEEANISSGGSGLGTGQFNAAEFEADKKRRTKAQEKRKQEEIKISTDAAQANINIAKKFQSDAAKISKDFNFNFFGDNHSKKTKTKTTKKTDVADTSFELERQRLERTISINNEIVKDSERTDEERLKSLENSENAQIELINKSKENQLKLTGETFNKEMKEGNKTNSGLIQLRENYEADKLKISEDASNKIIDVNKKTSEEIEKIRVFDEAKYTKDLENKISKQNTAMNTELTNEHKNFKSILDNEKLTQKERESALKTHEKAVFEIKKKYALDALKLQIDTFQLELDASDKLTGNEALTVEKRQQLQEKLSKAIQEYNELKVQSNIDANKKIEEAEKEMADKIKSVSKELYDALKDLVNTLFDTKIQNIDNEITKNNQKYDKEMELAGNDEAQKDLLQKERDKKNEELEKKKQKEQRKQAILNKAFALAEIAFNTTKAVMAVASTGGGTYYADFGVSAGILTGLTIALGAAQAATVLATPIPKYKMGRKGGKAETAWVGDGGINEVIERKSGKIELTPNVPTLTHLNQGDIVHSSIDSYNKSMRESIMASIGVEKNRMNEFHANQVLENNNKELVEEMRLTRKAIEKNRTNITVKVPKVDIEHAIWAAKNKNWNQ